MRKQKHASTRKPTTRKSKVDELREEVEALESHYDSLFHWFTELAKLQGEISQTHTSLLKDASDCLGRHRQEIDHLQKKIFRLETEIEELRMRTWSRLR